MSKKIIYLLSLLMALSLVFASCKKNAAGTGDLTPPPVDNETGKEDANQNTGLFEEWSKIPQDTFIKEYEIFQNDGTDFYRNPVLVSMGDGRVFLFAELRYRRAGAANDVGIDGEGAVDIVYRVSENSGYDWDSQTYFVVKNSENITDAHGAPNVFLLNNTTIVVVASAGSGIGRTAKAVGDKPASRVDYAIGTINGKTISWTDWKEVQTSDNILTKISQVNAGGTGGEKLNQYATVPGRGLVLNSGSSILLSLVIANQGTTQDGQVRELMGRYVLQGQISGNSITWKQIEDPVAYTTQAMNLGPWKETQLYGGDASTPKFLIVPSPWTGTPNLKLGKAQGTSKKTPDATTIPASEGSAGYVDLNSKWFGTSAYALTDGKISETTGGKQYSIFIHVADTTKNLTMRVIDNSGDAFTEKGSGWVMDPVGKSSSVDMLPDGTIIYAAEKGGDANARNYGFFFYRYSQYYIATQTGANNQ